MSKLFRTILAVAICCIVPLPLLAATAASSDGGFTAQGSGEPSPQCSGGECGGSALGAGGDGVNASGGTIGIAPSATVCTEDCGELPRAGDYGGLTEVGKAAAFKAASPAPAPGATTEDEGGTYDVPESKSGVLKAAVGPCDGNNTGSDYVNNISMGGPLVGIRWVPGASQTITRVEVFTGEVTAANQLAIWSHDSVLDQPSATLGATAAFTTVTTNGWQGADLATPVSVTGGQVYWIVWDPSGGEQASVTDAAGGIQQTYWGSYSGDVNGGASWFGPFSHSDHRWKFRMFCGKAPCDGNNYANTDHRDNVSTSNAVQAISWVPTVSATITRLEFYTGEANGPDRVGIYSNDSTGLVPRPLAPLGVSPAFPLSTTKGWQGSDLSTPVQVTAGQLYWVAWETSGGEQTPVNDDPGDIQQTYYGELGGDITSATFPLGPFSFTNMRWKFRVFCGEKSKFCDGNNHENDLYEDNGFMGGGMVAIEWIPAANETINGIEIFTGEATGPSILSLWSDAAGQPGSQIATTASFATVLPNGWQGAPLTSSVSVTAGQTYWVGWNNSGGEQVSATNDPAGIQQFYWGSWTNGASWYGPFKSWRWKFRMTCEDKKPCEGNNYSNDNYLDNVSMGGPMIGIRWVPTSSVTVSRVEVFTGETTATNTIAIWSSTGGLSPEPDAVIGGTGTFTVALGNGWQGADLPVPVSVLAGQEYWVVWDPVWQQAPVTGDLADIQQIYRGSTDGGASWDGPWSFSDRRWKFRMFCEGKAGCGPGVCIGDSFCDDCACYAPSSPVSIAFCRCKLADPACGLGECVPTGAGPAYCEGPYCAAPVCYLPSSPISQLLCGSGYHGCPEVVPAPEK